MMGFINSVTRLCCGVGVIDIRDRADQTKNFLIKAEERAKTKRLKEAIQLAKNGSRLWGQNPNFWEKLFRSYFLGDLLIKLEDCAKRWSEQMQNAQRLIQEGNTLLASVTDSPKDNEALEKALHCLQRAKNLIFDLKVNEQVKSYNIELQQRKHWVELFEKAKFEVNAKYFQKALPIYEETQKLYDIDELNELINVCKQGLASEQEYCQQLQTAKSYCVQADFQRAFTTAKAAIAKFDRQDGRNFLLDLERVLEAKLAFQKGLQHEQVGEFNFASDAYARAYNLMPELSECRFRMVIISCKQGTWQKALGLLEGLYSDRAQFLRGFIFAKQRKYDDAEQEWQGIKSARLDEQRSKLQIIKQKAYLLDLQAIEQFLDQGDIESAANVSHEALKRHAQADVIRNNLQKHILPRLDSEAWKNREINWNVLLEKMRFIWLERPTLQSLHNWAVAAYYCAMNSEYPNFDLLAEFSTSWGTAIANLPDDPSLNNLAWLGNTKPDRAKLKQKLEDLWDRVLNQIKEQDLNTYMQIRDWQRLDRYTLSVLKSPISQGIKLEKIWILPSSVHFLNSYESRLNKSLSLSIKSLMTNLQTQYKYLPTASQLPLLYSTLGLAIAACLDGDVERGLKLKKQISGNLIHKEHWQNAQAMICYFEACHFLKQTKWENAFKTIQQSPSLLTTTQKDEIDRLCEPIVRDLEEREKLPFSQEWLSAISSKGARNFYTECKVEEIRLQIAKEQSSPSKGLSKLKNLDDVDKNHPTYQDLVNRIEIILASEEVERYLQNKQYDEAVNRAISSGKLEVRERLAEIFMGALQAAQADGGGNPWETAQIAGWIRRLVPHLL